MKDRSLNLFPVYPREVNSSIVVVNDSFMILRHKNRETPVTRGITPEPDIFRAYFVVVDGLPRRW